MRRFLRDYSLSITLFILFAVSLALQGLLQWWEFIDEQRAHGQFVDVTQFWVVYGARVFENVQSEFLQLLTFVVLTSFLIHRGSHESKDADEEMQATLRRIEQRLGRIEAGGAGAGNGRHRRQGEPELAERR